MGTAKREVVSVAGDSLPEEREHLFALIVRWSTANGAKAINSLPGCWERSFNDPRPEAQRAGPGPHWHIAINGGVAPRKGGPKDGMLCDVDPITALVWWNGWLMGDVHMHGWQVGAGEGANEAALRAAILADMTPEA